MRVLIFLLLSMPTLWAQSYTAAQRVELATGARRLLMDKYLNNLEILTHYEANQPFDALRNQLNAFARDAFLNAEVSVFNEFRNSANAYTTIEEYVKDCRIFSGGNPIINSLSFPEARYEIRQTPAGEGFINVYLTKQMMGSDSHKKSFTKRNLLEFRVQFSVHKTLHSFYNFRIAGITKVEQWPAAAFTEQIAVLIEKPKDLLTVLDTLTAQVKMALPKGISQLVLQRFTYKNCGINDAMSDQVFAALSSCWQRQANLAISSVSERNSEWPILKGYYQEEGDQLKVVIELTDAKTGNIVAKAENTDLSLTWLNEQNLRLKPDNYEQVKEVQDTLKQITTIPQTALQVEIHTDRGRSGVEYWAGQQMILEATANRPCHLRLLYRLADGTQTVLETDFFIKEANKPVRIAPEAVFVCSAPYGTEYLLAYASEEPFCPLPKVPSQKGYIRKEGDYQIFVGSLMAFQTVMKCNLKGEIAEDHIQITTRDK
ncbi:MAG: DUF4384 domain-containing protein [Siphonobacter sp.]